MLLSDIPHMQRQKLAILERVQHDMSRVINPVFHSFTIAAAIYLPCYVNRVFFSNADGLDLLNFLLALSAIALVLMSPAFALAATLEVYLGRRIEPRRVCRRLQLLSRMEHHEQDNEQIFPRSA
ncbi:hypothetical protein Z946_696 [Sulfitobacter noctilucicola]|uniref:Uncharacterized protein n=1 Tax=Sulfitobacter noctilucicola TaxID=1342301 RepID=A0A7W6M701_9RHOB|nr:hypothetical protein [Sulfitobacter noctilucicola]KIN61841.1 hypothetical protein Z946_696 [Sulfitobacter noctilucicola]MBB4173638.1 hypothetical protein [Sulfitobacter noctilucicola]